MQPIADYMADLAASGGRVKLQTGDIIIETAQGDAAGEARSLA